jgi:hypothetical protein
MYSIKKDLIRENRIIIKYFLPNNKAHHIYEIENADWAFAERLLGQFVQDRFDLGWMDDLIRLSNKTIQLEDTGEWVVV